jgi:hypothetical protein
VLILIVFEIEKVTVEKKEANLEAPIKTKLLSKKKYESVY